MKKRPLRDVEITLTQQGRKALSSTVRVMTRTWTNNTMSRNLFVLERYLERHCFDIQRIFRNVSTADGVDSHDQPIRTSSNPSLVKGAIAGGGYWKRYMRQTGEEDYQSGTS